MNKDQFNKALFSLLVAAVGFSLIFGGIFFHFWGQMAITALVLTSLAFFFRNDDIRRQLAISKEQLPYIIALGLLSGVFLYFIFMIGNDLANHFISFGKAGIGGIYGFGNNMDPRMIAFLLLFIIGPGEEIFWRGYLQKTFVRHYGRLGVLFGVLAYAGVHLASGNPMLLLAAFSAGLFWALLYHYYKNLWVNIISHAFWDLIAFVVFPFS